ncbi:MAG: ATP-binding cassette domain-containing protein, partial [Acidimicrobiia bacterium]|nr:ATP-binding cassette domain-containing protein [Acidimicrobiia bacterium]
MAVTIRNLSVAIDRKPILDRVDADVAAGQWLSVIGPNGAGKTTLLRAVLGLVRHEGTVSVGGASVDHADPR